MLSVVRGVIGQMRLPIGFPPVDTSNDAAPAQRDKTQSQSPEWANASSTRDRLSDLHHSQYRRRGPGDLLLGKRWGPVLVWLSHLT